MFGLLQKKTLPSRSSVGSYGRHKEQEFIEMYVQMSDISIIHSAYGNMFQNISNIVDLCYIISGSGNIFA